MREHRRGCLQGQALRYFRRNRGITPVACHRAVDQAHVMAVRSAKPSSARREADKDTSFLWQQRGTCIGSVCPLQGASQPVEQLGRAGSRTEKKERAVGAEARIGIRDGFEARPLDQGAVENNQLAPGTDHLHLAGEFVEKRGARLRIMQQE